MAEFRAGLTAGRVGNARNEDRETVIRRDLISHFVRDSKWRFAISQGSMLLMIAFCWNYVDRTWALGWLALGQAIFAVHFALEAPYYGERRPLDTREAQERMVRVLAPCYVATGLLWGSPMLFYFMLDPVPRATQTACNLIVMGMSAAPFIGIVLVPKLMRCYAHAFFFALVASLSFRTVQRYGHTPEASYLFAVIPAVQWALMAWLFNRVYQRHRQMCELQHDLAYKEKEARQAIETKNRLLAAATHDIRQPVAALSLFAAHLVKFPHLHADLAPKIATATHAVNHLFDALFEHSALESDAVSVTLQDVDLGTLLTSLHAQFEPVATARGITLRVRPLQAIVRSDPLGLRRIIGNILANAISFSAHGTAILLAGRMQNDGPCLQVWDQGIGIETHEIDKIFDEFYRIEGRRALPACNDETGLGGIGLGLAVVARLSRLLDIRVDVKSIVNRGTRFTLRLPKAPPVQGGPRGG